MADYYETTRFFYENGFEQDKLIVDEIFAKRVAFECLRMHYCVNDIPKHRDEHVETMKLVFDRALYSHAAMVKIIGKTYIGDIIVMIETRLDRNTPENSYVEVYVVSKDNKYKAEVIRFDNNLRHVTGENIITGMLENVCSDGIISRNISVMSRYCIHDLYKAIANEIQNVRNGVFKTLNADAYFELIASNG